MSAPSAVGLGDLVHYALRNQILSAEGSALKPSGPDLQEGVP